MIGDLPAAPARVLVVEYHAVIALNLQMMLESLGAAEIELAASVAGALDKLDRANSTLPSSTSTLLAKAGSLSPTAARNAQFRLSYRRAMRLTWTVRFEQRNICLRSPTI